jgi:rhodanese-related sulfurtransferase
MNVPTAHRERPIVDYRAVVDATSQLVDVREPDELLSGSLPGAVNIPMAQIPARIEELDRARRVVLFCRSGGRSGSVARYLAGNGFPDVVNLAGGMLAYAEALQSQSSN